MAGPERSSLPQTFPVHGDMILDPENKLASLEVDWKGRHIRIEVTYNDKKVTLNRAMKDFIQAMEKMNDLHFSSRIRSYSPQANVMVYFDRLPTNSPRQPQSPAAAAAASLSDDSDSDSIKSATSDEDLTSTPPDAVAHEKKASAKKKSVRFAKDEVKLTRDASIDFKGTIETRGLSDTAKLQAVKPGTLESRMQQDHQIQTFDRLKDEAIQDLKARGITNPSRVKLAMTMKILNSSLTRYSRDDLIKLFQDLKLSLEHPDDNQKDDPASIKLAEALLSGRYESEVHITRLKESNVYTIKYNHLNDDILNDMIDENL